LLGGDFARVYDDGRKLSTDEAVDLANDAGGTQTAEYRIPLVVQPVSAAEPIAVPPPAVVATSRPAMMRALALGPLQVFVDGEPIVSAAWGSARPRELLAYLLMHP